MLLGWLRRAHWSLPAVATVAVALALRLLGIRIGLPYHHHWDEKWIVENVINMLRTSDAEPKSFMYGEPAARLIVGVFHSLGALFPHRDFRPDDEDLFRWIGRAVGAAISSTGAFAVFVATRCMVPGARWARTRAAYAGLLYATASELVTHGRYATVDASYVALTAWALAFAALYLRDGRLVWGASAVLAASAAVAFKVTALPALAIPALALMLRSGRLGSSRLAVRYDRAWVRRAFFMGALPSAAAFFFVLNPHVISNAPLAFYNYSDVGKQVMNGGVPAYLIRERGLEHLESIAQGLGTFGFHRWHLASATAAACGVAGLALGLARGSRICAVAALHAGAACCALAFTSKAYLFRNYLVAMPALCIGFGFAMQWVTVWLCEHVGTARNPGPRMTRWPALGVAAAFGLLFVLVPLAQAVTDQKLSADARMRAFDWLEARSAGRKATVACTPEIVMDHDGPRPALRGALSRRDLVILPDVEDTKAAATSGADYLVVTSTFDPGGVWGDRFRFSDVPGYRVADRFDANPYEHNLAITATWSGRYSTIVLERIDHRS